MVFTVCSNLRVAGAWSLSGRRPRLSGGSSRWTVPPEVKSGRFPSEGEGAMEAPLHEQFHRRASDRLSRRESDLPVEPSPNGKPRRRQEDGWLDRWVATVSDLTRLKTSHP